MLVLTSLGGSASAAVSRARTIPPREDKAGTSSMEAPMAQALAARSRSKASDDTLADDNCNALIFAKEIKL
jgi:hypothetical protein